MLTKTNSQQFRRSSHFSPKWKSYMSLFIIFTINNNPFLLKTYHKQSVHKCSNRNLPNIKFERTFEFLKPIFERFFLIYFIYLSGNQISAIPDGIKSLSHLISFLDFQTFSLNDKQNRIFHQANSQAFQQA